MTIKELMTALYEDLTNDPGLADHKIYVRPFESSSCHLKLADIGYDGDMNLIVDVGGDDDE